MTSGSWKPPSYQSLVLTCDGVAKYYASGMRSVQTNSETFHRDLYEADADVPLTVTISYLRSIIPANYTPVPTDGDLMGWYYDTLDLLADNRTHDYDAALKFSERGLSFAQDVCRSDFCRFLGYEGDSDITGVGMLIAYYVAASFATIFFFVILAARLSAWWDRRAGRRDRLYKYVAGFRESTIPFLETALIFDISMLGAAVTRYSSSLKHADQPYSLYSLLGSAFMPTFATFVALLLQSMSDSLRMNSLRLVLWTAVVALTITLKVQSEPLLREDSDGVSGWLMQRAEGAHLAELFWYGNCDATGEREVLRRILNAGHIFILLNSIFWLYYLLVAVIGWKVPGLTRWKGIAWLHRHRIPLRTINGFVAGVFMWLFLASFHNYKNEVSELSGRSDKDSKWTFGQVLSLATWAPVAYEVVNVYFYGPEKGLGHKISKRYEVTRRYDEQGDPDRTTKRSSESGTNDCESNFPVQFKNQAILHHQAIEYPPLDHVYHSQR